jgi:hypothetical protein
MIPSAERATADGRHRTTGVLAIAIALMLTGLGLTGCGIVRAVRKVTNAVQANKATIDQFTTSLTSGQPKAFEATYVTTGSSPARIVYAASPPKELAFKETARGGNASSTNLDIVVNSAGEYACTPPFSGSGSRWTCQQMGTASAAAQNQILGFYTPAHWVTFLRAFSLAAGFAGDKVSSSDMTVNGFSMHCVDFRAGGIPGTSKICTTTQGILGYVKVASQTTSFQLKAYSATPPASLFQLPRGARVIKLKKGAG